MGGVGERLRSSSFTAGDCAEDDRLPGEIEATCDPLVPPMGGDADAPSSPRNLPLFTSFLALLAKYPSSSSCKPLSSPDSCSRPLTSPDEVDSVSVPSESDLILYLFADDSGRREFLDAEVRLEGNPGEEGLLPATELDVGTRTVEGVLVGPILVIVMAEASRNGDLFDSCHPVFCMLDCMPMSEVIHVIKRADTHLGRETLLYPHLAKGHPASFERSSEGHAVVPLRSQSGS
jgi:hypothetical protein